MTTGKFLSGMFLLVFGILIGFTLFYRPTGEIKEKMVRVEKTVYDMQGNEFGYTVPWAVSYDGKTYEINPNYSVFPSKRGTVTMLVKRTENGGYCAYPMEKIEIWSVHWPNGIGVEVIY